MPQPDKEKKTVSQTGYDDANIAPFTDNYKELYRELLQENMELKEQLEKYASNLKELYHDIIGDEENE
jgi:predicted restriction endonuclease|tara:strand:+ start:1371 stop:1574 length:204 start_codon:yes stop_codon:yes gene_type:complete